jgi:hypothetical protein
VTVTSKSLDSGAVRNLTDFSSDSWFSSQNAPDQWICWISTKCAFVRLITRSRVVI